MRTTYKQWEGVERFFTLPIVTQPPERLEHSPDGFPL